MDNEDEVLPVEKRWGRLLHNQPYGACPELDVLEEIAEKGPRASRYEESRQHIVSCGNCREVIDQLRLLNTQWQQSSEGTGQAKTKFSLRRIFPAFVSSGFALAGALAVILLVVLFFDRAHVSADRRQRRQIEQQLALETERFNRLQQEQAQAQKQYAVEKAQLEQDLRAAIIRPSLLIPDNKNLIAQASRSLYIRMPEGFGKVRGTDNSLPLLPKYPSGIVLREMRPTFLWKKLPGAEDYQVTLTPYSGAGANMRPDKTGQLQSPWQAANRWDLAGHGGGTEALRPGQKYEWRVAWRTKGKPKGVSAFARFETIDAQAEERLENAVLVSGIQQAQAGRLEEAEKDFQSVLTANPHNTAARRLSEALRRSLSAPSPPGL